MTEFPARPWHIEFAPDELEIVRSSIPQAIQESQARSARAHIAYSDPDDDQYVYGAGMARGVQKELSGMLSKLPSFRRSSIEGTPRELLFVGPILLFPIRVGKRMPRNIHHVRISYLPEVRKNLFHSAGMHKYDEPALFETDDGDAKPAMVEDAINYISGIAKDSLIVPYYSSTPDGVGSIYWAPAKLAGKNYLEFSDPESLTYISTVNSAGDKPLTREILTTFADGSRPRTVAKLRKPRADPGLG